MSFRDAQSFITVRPSDLDSLGHVNNARVLEYLEQGRWEWRQVNGLSSNSPIFAVVSRIEVDYRKELFFGPLQVDTQFVVDEDATYRVKFAQRIRAAGSDDIAVNAVVHVAFISARDRALCTIDDFISASTVRDTHLAETLTP